MPIKLNFLFQNFEGVLGLTRRKAIILTFLSMAGLLLAVVLTVLFALEIEKSKYIPGVIVLGCMMVLNVIFLLQGKYRSAIRVIFFLPVAMYFLYINGYYAIAMEDDALRGVLAMLYGGFLYLFVFSYSVRILYIFYGTAQLVLAYFMYSTDYFDQLRWIGSLTLFNMGNPFIELTVVGGVCVLLYIFFDQNITRTANESNAVRSSMNEWIRQSEIGIMVLQVQRDEYGEKSGMIVERTNPVFERTFKVVREEVTGVDFSAIFPKLFQNSFNWQEVFFHSPKSKLQVYIPHLEQWFNINNVFPEQDRIISSFVNVSSFKNETERLKLREERLTKLMGSLPDIFFIIEKDGTYIDYVSNNPELMKLSQEDIIGKTIFEMGFSKPMSYQIYSSIQYVLEHDNIETIEYGMELSNGKTLIFEMRLARLNENQIISIGRDITTKKEYEHQLIEAKRKTEEAARLKSAFLENISHEMRTPMNAIIGFSQLALEKQFNEDERRNFLDIVIKNGEKLMDIVTNVIDISEIESGTMSVKMKSCMLNEFCQEMYQKYEKIIRKLAGHIQLEVAFGDPIDDVEIFTDEHLLSKIIGHLIDNAIKFTAQGKITFGYTIESDEVKFFVKDTGIGIAKENTESVYRQFHQTDNRSGRKYSGTGIGLTIVKHLTDLLGGSVEFESKPGEGTVFYFFLHKHNYLKVVKE